MEEIFPFMYAPGPLPDVDGPLSAVALGKVLSQIEELVPRPEDGGKKEHEKKARVRLKGDSKSRFPFHTSRLFDSIAENPAGARRSFWKWKKPDVPGIFGMHPALFSVNNLGPVWPETVHIEKEPVRDSEAQPAKIRDGLGRERYSPVHPVIKPLCRFPDVFGGDGPDRVRKPVKGFGIATGREANWQNWMSVRPG